MMIERGEAISYVQVYYVIQGELIAASSAIGLSCWLPPIFRGGQQSDI